MERKSISTKVSYRKIAISLFFVIFMKAGINPSESFSAEKIIRWAYSQPAKRTFTRGWEWLGPEFEKRTAGRYKIEYYPGETLFKLSAAYDSVLSNVAQISDVSTGHIEKRVPLSTVALLPTLDFPPTMGGRSAASKSFLQLYQKFPQIQEEFRGLKVFGYHQLYPYVLVSRRKEIFLPDHFKGLKVGGTGARMRMVSGNGGAEVTQIPPDSYMNLDKGVVDACFVNWSQIVIYKLWEVAKYIYDFGFGAGGIVLIMNMDLWKEMSENDQKTFMELWRQAFTIGNENNWREVEKGKKTAMEYGVKIRKPTDAEVVSWKNAALPVIEKWVADCKKLGTKDPESVLKEWTRIVEGFKE